MKTPIESLDEMIAETKASYAQLEARFSSFQRDLQGMQASLVATNGAIQGLEAFRAKLAAAEETKEPQCLPTDPVA